MKLIVSAAGVVAAALVLTGSLAMGEVSAPGARDYNGSASYQLQASAPGPFSRGSTTRRGWRGQGEAPVWQH